MNQFESPSAQWKPSSGGDEQRAFLQQRVSLFAKLMFLIFWVLVAFVIAIYEVYPHMRPERAHIIHRFAWGGLAVFAAVWYVALRRRQSSVGVLRFVEAFLVFGIGLTFALSAYLSADQHVNVYSAFIWLSFMVFGRVLVIPSGGRRTAVLSSLAMMPLVVSSILLVVFEPAPLPIPALVLISGTAFYAVVTVLLATIGSSVLYGLRKQVREAMQLGQYTLDHKLGEGGMGVVYKASHKMLRRPTAIKLLRRAETADLERFEREVQATSELTHPNTVAIFDYGRSPEGVFYYVMEYLEGTDLERLVREDGPQPFGRVVHILRQICGALDEAHSRALIHRDIKPANILLCPRGHVPDVVKVCDFGLVKEVGGASTTGVNQVAGTPGYLAPEAVTHPDEVGPKSDLYAVGAVGYYLVTGDPVFTGATPMDVCLSHVDRQPVPPSQRSDNPVAPELERLIMQCLEKDPARRPESALALRRALGEVPRDERWSEDVAREWWRTFDISKGDESGPLTLVSSTTTVTVDLSARTETGLLELD